MDLPILGPFRRLQQTRAQTRTQVRRRSLRTARCLLVDGERHLLVVHAGKGRHRNPRWGLPGGHIDPGEAPERAALRELEEELELRLENAALSHVSDYRYKGSWHRVYAASCAAPITRFDTRELLEIGWFSVEEVQELADSDALHAGYEIDVVRQLAEASQAFSAAS